MSKDQEHILNELESFYEGKLNEVRAKRSGQSKPSQSQEVMAGAGVLVRLYPARKEVTLSWADVE